MIVHFTFRRPLLRSNTDESDIDDSTLSLTTCLSKPLKISHKIKLPKRDSNEGATPSICTPHYGVHIQEESCKIKKLVEQHSTFISKYIYLSIYFLYVHLLDFYASISSSCIHYSLTHFLLTHSHARINLASIIKLFIHQIHSHSSIF